MPISSWHTAQVALSSPRASSVAPAALQRPTLEAVTDELENTYVDKVRRTARAHAAVRVGGRWWWWRWSGGGAERRLSGAATRLW